MAAVRLEFEGETRMPLWAVFEILLDECHDFDHIHYDKASLEVICNPRHAREARLRARFDSGAAATRARLELGNENYQNILKAINALLERLGVITHINSTHK